MPASASEGANGTGGTGGTGCGTTCNQDKDIIVIVERRYNDFVRLRQQIKVANSNGDQFRNPIGKMQQVDQAGSSISQVKAEKKAFPLKARSPLDSPSLPPKEYCKVLQLSGIDRRQDEI